MAGCRAIVEAAGRHWTLINEVEENRSWMAKHCNGFIRQQQAEVVWLPFSGRDDLLCFGINSAVKEIGVFGSFIRGEERMDGDVDILVDFDKPIDLFRFLDLEERLSELSGKAGMRDKLIHGYFGAEASEFRKG